MLNGATARYSLRFRHVSFVTELYTDIICVYNNIVPKNRFCLPSVRANYPPDNIIICIVDACLLSTQRPTTAWSGLRYISVLLTVCTGKFMLRLRIRSIYHCWTLCETSDNKKTSYMIISIHNE